MKSTILAAVVASLTGVLSNPVESTENHKCPRTTGNALHYNAKLPDPFHFVDGQPVRNIRDWQCRQVEISNLMQSFELGIKPKRPMNLSATLEANGTLAITASEGNRSITFSPTITYPDTGEAPFPALIAVGGLSIPAPSGVAIVTLDNNDLALQDNYASRGIGKFYDLYGNNSAGAMVGWAWGISRILDALEQTPTARINPSRVGVTGCSRNGKGALVAGALDDRIALTIPQESGSGGSACWRLSDYENHNGSTQTASEIWTENVWFATTFDRFANSTVDVLPFDHHMLAGLVAPRGLLVIDNIGYEWLGPFSCFECMQTGRKIYEALGVPQHMGISQSPNHTHCSFPDYQQPELDAFVAKFLFDEEADTNVVKTAGNYTWNPAQWVDWKTPKLR